MPTAACPAAHSRLPSDHGSGGEGGGDSPAAFLGEAAGVVLLLRHASSTLHTRGRDVMCV